MINFLKRLPLDSHSRAVLSSEFFVQGVYYTFCPDGKNVFLTSDQSVGGWSVQIDNKGRISLKKIIKQIFGDQPVQLCLVRIDGELAITTMEKTTLQPFSTTGSE